MELTAALEAIRAFEDWPILVVSDSAYLVNCFHDKWYVSWQRNRWITKGGKPVANKDIWVDLVHEALRSRTTFRKVKGHSGDPMNEYVDQLAVKAKKAMLK
jgi:ribonuclease HI